MYNTFSIKPTYNTFSYQDINTSKNTIIIPPRLISPLIGIITEQNAKRLTNENKAIKIHKENIVHTINKDLYCTCVSTNIVKLIDNLNIHNTQEIMRKVALFFLINDMVNYYYKEQKDITFHQLNNSPKIMNNIYNNYVDFSITHNDITCDLASIILHGNHINQNNYSNNVKQAYYAFNTPSPENNNDNGLIDNIFNIHSLLGDLKQIPINLKISSIVNFIDNKCFLLPVVKDFCVKTIIVKDGYSIDYDAFYNIDYNEFISFIIEINNLFNYLLNNNPNFMRDYNHIDNLVNYALNNVENPRIVSEPLSLLYFMILYDIPENKIPINSSSVESVVCSINSLLERKESVLLKDFKESITHYSKNTIPLDMIFSIIN